MTFSAAARLLGHKSRGQLYRARDDGRLDAYLRPGGLELEPDGLPTLAQHLRRVTRCHARAAGNRVPPAAAAVDGLPPYEVSKARLESLTADLLELKRRRLEEQLVPAEQAEGVWAEVVSIARAKMLAVADRFGAAVPRLTAEEVEIVLELLREAMEELDDVRLPSAG